jgi:iron complex transport system permease protein
VTALIGAPLLLWLLPRLRSMSAPSMDAGDNVPTERQNVQWFALAWPLLLLACGGSSSARCPRLALD